MKQTLTPKTAEEYARKLFEKENEEDRAWHLLHSKLVGEIAVLLSKGKKVDKNLILTAGWLHDIGQIEGFDDHAVKGLKLAEKQFEISPSLKDCILNHGSGGNPECEEAKLIFLADKISMLHPEFLEFFMKYSAKKTGNPKKKDLDFVKSMLSKVGDLLEKV